MNVLFSNKDLKKMLIPLVIEQVLVMLVGMVDTVMVAWAGEAAVSGVSLVDMVNYLVITVMAALTTGGSVTALLSTPTASWGAIRFLECWV